MANLIGLITFFSLGKNLWVMSENGRIGGPGDGLYAAFILFPILAIYAIINIITIILIVRRWKHPCFKVALGYWFIVVVFWVIDVGIFYYNIQGRTPG
jgi:hypothetical protein